MTLLQDFVDYFTSQSIITPMFTDSIPSSPDTAVCLYEYQGSAGLPQVDGVTRQVQIVARSKSPGEAITTANKLFKLVQTEDGILNLTPDRWCLLIPLQPPFKIRVDDLNRVYYGFNATVNTYYD